MTHNLLTRDQFRSAVFERDNHQCVICKTPAKDAHHILERRLWDDGGYYLDNGASVCALHHILCEQTDISVAALRTACKITRPILPPHMYSDVVYDKWGNIELNGYRLRGELFYDESVQKALKGHLEDFTSLVKYPRTHHLPWSEGMHGDDRAMTSIASFMGARVIVTEKLDGENTSFYKDAYHARSTESTNHESQTWAKNFWAKIKHDIPTGWRICVENVYATHSVEYTNLDSYVYGFSIWNELNKCLSWDETLEWFDLFGITPVPVLYDGVYNEYLIRALWKPGHEKFAEGYVVRTAHAFTYGAFRRCVGKFARKDHVQTVQHWKYGQIVTPNKLKDGYK